MKLRKGNFFTPFCQSFCSRGGGAGMAGGMHGGRGHVWWGACMVGGIHGRGGVHVWQGACMASGGVHGGEMATEVGGTHPTGMYSCWR